MKLFKFKFLIFFFLIFIFSVSISIFFLKNARESNTWPFNAKIGKYFPAEIKKIVYNISNPYFNKKIETFYYDIELQYSRIPYFKSVGLGGSVNEIYNNIILVTLNNGQNFIYNINKNSFTKINYNKLNKAFISIRDVNIIKDLNQTFLIVLGITENKEGCRSLTLKKIGVNYNYAKNLIKFKKIKKIWSSDIKCEGQNAIATFGSRVIFIDGEYFVTMGYVSSSGPGGINKHSQDKNSMFGKILKINESGNYTIYSSGHRNPQGLFYSKRKKKIFSTEHGPSGGDEINLIIKNKNYGWPCETYGILYEFKNNNSINPWPKDIYNCTNIEFNEALFSWTPSIAISQGFEYFGEEFKYFNNNLIIGSLIGSSLFRINLDKDNIVRNIERINIKERVRDIIQLKNGKILVLTDSGNILLIKKSQKK